MAPPPPTPPRSVAGSDDGSGYMAADGMWYPNQEPGPSQNQYYNLGPLYEPPPYAMHASQDHMPPHHGPPDHQPPYQPPQQQHGYGMQANYGYAQQPMAQFAPNVYFDPVRFDGQDYPFRTAPPARAPPPQSRRA